MPSLNPLSWFSDGDVVEFGRSLARDLSARYPIEMERRAGDKKGEKTLGKALNAIYKKARGFKEEHRLGVYRKARLGNAFKWELREMGYRDEFVEEATKGLVLNISRK